MASPINGSSSSGSGSGYGFVKVAALVVGSYLLGKTVKTTKELSETEKSRLKKLEQSDETSHEIFDKIEKEIPQTKPLVSSTGGTKHGAKGGDISIEEMRKKISEETEDLISGLRKINKELESIEETRSHLKKGGDKLEKTTTALKEEASATEKEIAQNTARQQQLIQLRDQLTSRLALQPEKSFLFLFMNKQNQELAEKLTNKFIKDLPPGSKEQWKAFTDSVEKRKTEGLISESPKVKSGEIGKHAKAEAGTSIAKSFATFCFSELLGHEKFQKLSVENPFFAAAVDFGSDEAAKKSVQAAALLGASFLAFNKELEGVKISKLPKVLTSKLADLTQQCQAEITKATSKLNENSKTWPKQVQKTVKGIRRKYRRLANQAIKAENLKPSVVKEALKKHAESLRSVLKSQANQIAKGAQYLTGPLAKYLGLEEAMGVAGSRLATDAMKSGLKEAGKQTVAGYTSGRIVSSLFFVGHMLPSMIISQAALTMSGEALNQMYKGITDPAEREKLKSEFQLEKVLSDPTALTDFPESVTHMSDLFSHAAQEAIQAAKAYQLLGVGDDLSNIDGGEPREAIALLETYVENFTEGFKAASKEIGPTDLSDISGDMDQDTRQVLPKAFSSAQQATQESLDQAIKEGWADMQRATDINLQVINQVLTSGKETLSTLLTHEYEGEFDPTEGVMLPSVEKDSGVKSEKTVHAVSKDKDSIPEKFISTLSSVASGILEHLSTNVTATGSDYIDYRRSPSPSSSPTQTDKELFSEKEPESPKSPTSPKSPRSPRSPKSEKNIWADLGNPDIDSWGGKQ